MEYLPEKKRTQKTQILKKDARIKKFRQELVDNNVVLAIVKCKSHSHSNSCQRAINGHKHLSDLSWLLPVCRLGCNEKLAAVTRGPSGALHGLRWQLEEPPLGRHGGNGRWKREDWTRAALTWNWDRTTPNISRWGPTQGTHRHALQSCRPWGY